MKAYITSLSTDNYLIGVLSLNECLKKVHSKYNLVVQISQNLSNKTKKILAENKIQTIETEHFKVPDWIKEKNSSGHNNWTNTFDKLMIFELTQYEKLVMLDSDMYVRKNIDELFDKPNFSATVDRQDTILVKDNYQKLTSGLIVIEPKKGITNEFLEIMQRKDLQNKGKNLGDQDIIQLYDPNWEKEKDLHLPLIYNMFFMDLEYFIHKNIYKLDDIKVFHFITVNKPWNYKQEELTTKYLDWLQSVCKSDYNSTKLEELKENIEFGRENQKIIINEYGKILNDCFKKIK